ncbi:MAG: TRAP transporter substrate-binding protein [Burkholderiales bacterium]|nr:MAG: TRAP transporter substrate-binding protein [Burkholderiales bacterium]
MNRSTSRAHRLLTLASALALGLVAGVLAVVPQSSRAADITLTYAFFAPAGTFPGRQMAHWAEQINKRTNGKVEVRTFPGGTLLGAREMYDGVSKGVADIGLGSPSYDPGRFPLTSGVSLPLGFPNSTVASRTLWAATKEFQPKEYAPYKVIAMFTTEPGHIQSRNPVRNAADLKGLKLRAAGTGVPVLAALGAAPVGMPMPEVPQAVQTGVIEGTMTSREVLKDFRLAETLKFVTDYPTVVVTFAAVMDRKRFERLPDDVKKVIDELAEEMPVWTGQYHDQQNVGAALQWSKQQHQLQVLTLADDERARWDAALAPMVSNWIEEMKAKGLPAERYIDRVRALRDRFARQ